MTGLDSNVLLRHLVKDDPKQTPRAHRFLTQELTTEDPGYLSHVVLSEVVWTLDRGYHYRKPDIIAVLEQVFLTRNLVIENPVVTWRALRLYTQKDAGFADCLIVAGHRDRGCARTVTFDQEAARLPGCDLLAD